MPSATPRALRRAHNERMKARARKIMKLWSFGVRFPMTARDVGRNASTHCRPCSCWLCQPQREVPTPRERAYFDMSDSVN